MRVGSRPPNGQPIYFHSLDRAGDPINTFIKQAFTKDVVLRAILMAAIVGTVLVTINHGMCLYSGKFGWGCLCQSILTYFVPYGVSTISSVLATIGQVSHTR